ncbi:hypothetical protein V7793_24850 [Streptomyces sp. KLMMK]|uniref:hypothetical protein n=1 Tax=Streptomyces sp. KLMMK TaxID=3109353 RepID=UPI00300BBBC6
MRTRKAALVGALCAGLSVALTGCGGGGTTDPDAGTNGVGRLDPAKIQDKARSAAREASSVHLSGSVVSQGRTYKLDMRLKRDGGTGRVASDASTFELLRVGDELFLKAPAAFWSRGDKDDKGAKDGKGDGAAAAGKLEKKYVKVPTGDPAYQQFKGFTDKDVLLDGLIGLHGKLDRGEHGTVAGVPTIRVNGAGGSGGTLDVSLMDTPYPLRVRRAGGAGQLELSDWGKDFALTPPPKQDTVDYGKRIPAAGEGASLPAPAK